MIDVRMTDEAFMAGVDPSLMDLFRDQLKGDWRVAILDINPLTGDLRLHVLRGDLITYLDIPAALLKMPVDIGRVIAEAEDTLEHTWLIAHSRGEPFP